MATIEDPRLLELMEAAPDAMVCVDAAGRIIAINTQAERLFGYRAGELTGQVVETLVPDAARPVHPGHRTGYMADPRLRPMGAGLELSGQRKDGSTFPAEISLGGIGTGQVLVMAAIRDITERLAVQEEREQLRRLADRARLEQQLQQAHRLESLGQLAGGVAHDFNNLLGVIMNYAEFIAEDLRNAPGSGSSALSDIEQIQQAAGRAARLTHQLLAFARSEVVQPRVLNLNEAISSILDLLRRTLGEHVELSTSLEPGILPILADPGQIEQILVNLAVNARDAMPDGGVLIIQTSNVDVDAAYASFRANLPEGRYVALKVSDNGQGMPAEVADRAFEPFFTTKPKGEGSGLGLATVYGIVTQAGGNIRIYSEPGLSTTITALLPATDSAPAAERPPAEADPGGTELVLLVEDETAMRKVTERLLARHGYRVIATANGQQAITEAAQLDQIDILLTDVIMPGMQGKEVAARVRELHPDIAVLFMSGYTQGLLSAQGVLEPGIYLLEKPFNEASLLSKLREVLRSSGASAE